MTLAAKPDASVGGKGGGDGLWRFALALYARADVADALLALQDQRGCDVDLMLYALWLGMRGVALDAAGFAAAAAAVAPVNAVVQQLRGLRRQLGGIADRDIAPLRRRVLALELAAERRVLARLAGLAATASPSDGRASAEHPAGSARVALADANLARYLGGREAALERQAIGAALRGLMRADGSPRQAVSSRSPHPQGRSRAARPSD